MLSSWISGPGLAARCRRGSHRRAFNHRFDVANSQVSNVAGGETTAPHVIALTFAYQSSMFIIHILISVDSSKLFFIQLSVYPNLNISNRHKLQITERQEVTLHFKLISCNY